ncbi:MAG: esterase family protein [Chloroflexi bacterium]|nr:esterase family protein [Chloroflexota bacterium]
MTTRPLLQLARTKGNPVVEGRRVTFVWKGRSAPYFIDDIHQWEESPQKMKRVAPGLWTHTLELDSNAYLEYAFLDPRTKKRLKDPLNQKTVFNGIKHYNHYFYMPEASPTPYAVKRKGIPSGRVTRHLVDTWMIQQNGKRELHLYQPPVKGPVPLLLVYDGTDYLKRANLNIIVDNLIHEKRIRPIAMAFLQNGGDRRSVEYACSDATLMDIEHFVLPFAAKKLTLIDIRKNRGAYGVLGASFGGLMSVYTGLRMPEFFGKVIAQSSVFELEGKDFVAVGLIRAKMSREIKIWMDIGHFDWLLGDNRRIQPLLQNNGYNVIYHEAPAGHNFTFWRDELPQALINMFG